MHLQRVWTAANWERLLAGDLFNKGVMGGLLLTLVLGFAAADPGNSVVPVSHRSTWWRRASTGP